jgi:hypothetical protein
MVEWTGLAPPALTRLSVSTFFLFPLSHGSSCPKKAKAYAEQKRASKLLAPTADAATKVAADDALKVLKVLLSLPAR